MSSAEMIRAANGLTRSPINDYSETRSLPEPTDEAVRTECRPGLVKEQKHNSLCTGKRKRLLLCPHLLILEIIQDYLRLQTLMEMEDYL